MRVLFLCTELAGYFSNCIERLSAASDVDITIVYYPNSANAPFEHQFIGINLINRKRVTRKDLIEAAINFNPDIVYVTGWIDPDYKHICKVLKRRRKITVCGVDNAWKGTLRQRLACFLSPCLVKPYFTYLWVAGHKQYYFARQLGYAFENILTGLYVADILKFNTINASQLNKRLVYVGRLEREKGIDNLYKVFSSLRESERNEWTLDIIGNGTLRTSLTSTSVIKVFDFMQPNELVPFVADAGGFILPSIDEPWGVVVQEMAAAGKPLILSNKVNSGETFLLHGYNGFRFEADNPDDLKAILLNFFSLNENQRKDMGTRSIALANTVNPETWVATLKSLWIKRMAEVGESN